MILLLGTISNFVGINNKELPKVCIGIVLFFLDRDEIFAPTANF